MLLTAASALALCCGCSASTLLTSAVCGWAAGFSWVPLQQGAVQCTATCAFLDENQDLA